MILKLLKECENYNHLCRKTLKSNNYDNFLITYATLRFYIYKSKNFIKNNYIEQIIKDLYDFNFIQYKQIRKSYNDIKENEKYKKIEYDRAEWI